tara:strand:- start:179 stop:307 length:129 start_codon:yes stop_codon:yes gene_type:complete
MKRIKKIGKIVWGVVYICGGIVATILILPIIGVISLINIIKN